MMKLFLLFLFVSLLEGLVVKDKSFRVKGAVREFQSFGFEKGGTVSLNVSADESKDFIGVYICNAGDFTRLVNEADADGTGGICNDRTSCEVAANITDPRLQLYSVKSRDLYHLLIINCRGNEVQAHLTYTLLNPSGKQLSLGYKPLPSLYLVLTSVWMLLLIAWGFLWVMWRTSRVPLHTILLIVVLLKFLVTLVALCYWRICEETGNCMDQLRYLQSFLFAVSETGFFCALLLIAKGWKITRTRLPSSEIRTISLALILLLSTLLFFSFYNDGYYFLSLMIMYFFMLPRIFTSITRNTRALETQLLLYNQANSNADIVPVNLKLRLFKTLRTAVVVYLVSILLVNAMRIIMVWYLEWFNFVMNELVVLIMVSIICYVLLPSNTALFSPDSISDGNLPFSLYNVDDLFGEGGEITVNVNEQLPDMSNIIVIEYPYDHSQEEPLIPLALGVTEKEPKDKSTESPV